jgi:hypothetical protein
MPRDFTLESQLEKAIEALRRDLSYIMQEASKGKLSAPTARDLVAYIKLLTELKLGEDEVLSKLTPEQLKALADESDKQTSSSEGT